MTFTIPSTFTFVVYPQTLLSLFLFALPFILTGLYFWIWNSGFDSGVKFATSPKEGNPPPPSTAKSRGRLVTHT